MSNYFRTLLHLAWLLHVFVENSESSLFFLHNSYVLSFFILTRAGDFIFSPLNSYLHQIMWGNGKKENTIALIFRTLPNACREAVQDERRDYGSVTSDFSLLLIASVVWKASCGKRATHGYYTQTYYPWQKKWDEKREIIVKAALPQGGITHSQQAVLVSLWLEKIA